MQQRSDSTRSFELVATLLHVRNDAVKDLLYFGPHAPLAAAERIPPLPVFARLSGESCSRVFVAFR